MCSSDLDLCVDHLVLEAYDHRGPVEKTTVNLAWPSLGGEKLGDGIPQSRAAPVPAPFNKGA